MNDKKIIVWMPVLLVLTVVSVFAFPQGRQSAVGDEDCGPMNSRLARPPMERMDRMDSAGPSIMGSIVSIDAAKQIVVVENADAQKISVKMNPLTRIVRIERPQEDVQDEPAAGQNRRMPANRPEIERLTVENLKAGDWVLIKAFKTETKTVEARVISVFTKEKTAAVK